MNIEKERDCTGCTDRHSEGTHQMHTVQHPCPEGGDPNCGYCFPEKEGWEKEWDEELPSAVAAYLLHEEKDNLKGLVRSALASEREVLVGRIREEVAEIFRVEETSGKELFGERNAFGCAKEKVLDLLNDIGLEK